MIFDMNTEKNILERWKPGVSRTWLLVIAGMLWICIGLLLDLMACSWLKSEAGNRAIISAVAGFMVALLIHHFGFLRVVDKNLDRILPMKGTRCLFSFISWRSYCLVAVMMLTGYLLRHSPLPKLYLAVIYSAIGTALILSSLRYLRYLFKTVKGKDAHY